MVVARYALREAVRRRVILVVGLLTVCFLALYGLGCVVTFDEIGSLAADDQLDDRVLAGSTLLGLSMFTTLFLGAVLAVFLTLGVVRGDAERGLLQPLVVRPVGRTSLLLGRFAGAAVVCAAYVALVYLCAVLITGITGDWWPDRPVGPGVGLVLAVVVIAAISLLGSIFLSSTANASPSSCCSAPGSPPDCSARAAMRWRCRRSRTWPRWPPGSSRSRRSTRPGSMALPPTRA